MCSFVFLPSFLIVYFDVCCFVVFLLCLVPTIKTNDGVSEVGTKPSVGNKVARMMKVTTREAEDSVTFNSIVFRVC